MGTKKQNNRIEQIIDEIQHIRSSNNKLWMDILRMAVNSKPSQTIKLIKKINANDIKISKLFGEIN